MLDEEGNGEENGENPINLINIGRYMENPFDDVTVMRYYEDVLDDNQVRLLTDAEKKFLVHKLKGFKHKRGEDAALLQGYSKDDEPTDNSIERITC